MPGLWYHESLLDLQSLSFSLSTEHQPKDWQVLSIKTNIQYALERERERRE
ncbi:MAG: hypothetical protein KGI08_04295 [Thaumarchaeota archaeon]|nr:hypothetical protein [Nitrososphaerota archaeon]